VIPISTPELKALVEELKADFKKVRNTENLVFTCDGQRIEPMLLRRALQKACKEAVFIDEKGQRDSWNPKFHASRFPSLRYYPPA